MTLLDWAECAERSEDPGRPPAGGQLSAALGERVLIIPADYIPISA